MASSLFFLSTDAEILDLIRKGDDKGLAMLYEANRKPVRAFISRNHGTTDDADDMLQEALVVLWERVRTNRFEYTARLGTFLYATVRNLWLRKLARTRREVPTDNGNQTTDDDAVSALDVMVESEEARIVQEELERLGDPCKTLLLLYYWEEQTMEQIAAALNFANADTAKSKKYQCKKALQKLLKARLGWN
jgi:RNA polymerase sigma factor (sigma-70 family)